jgi:hypothetical protein
MFSPACPPNLLHPSDQPRSCATRVEDRQLGSAPTSLPDCQSPRGDGVVRLCGSNATPVSPATGGHGWQSGADAHRTSCPLSRVGLGTLPGSTLKPLQSRFPMERLGESPAGASEGFKVEMFSAMTTAKPQGDAYRSNGLGVEPHAAGVIPGRSYIVWPVVASMFKQGKEVNTPMSRSGLGTLPLLEGIEDYDRLLTRVASDGVISLEEHRQMERALKSLRRKCERLHDSLAFVDRALHGNGIYGEWFEQKRKENVRDRLYLVRSEDDDPTPAGPAAAKKKAA